MKQISVVVKTHSSGMALNRLGGHRIAAGPAFLEGLLLRESFLAVVTYKNAPGHKKEGLSCFISSYLWDTHPIIFTHNFGFVLLISALENP